MNSPYDAGDTTTSDQQTNDTARTTTADSSIIKPPAFFLPPPRLPASLLAVQRPVDIKNRPRIPIPDEDPYSVAGNGGGSSGSSGFGASGSGLVAASREHLMQQGAPMGGGQRRSEKPPKLPPRDNLYATHEIGKVST